MLGKLFWNLEIEIGASKYNIVNTFKIFVVSSFQEGTYYFHSSCWNSHLYGVAFPQGSPISFTHFPPLKQRGTPRLERGSHLIVHNNRTGAVKLWQLEWGKISNNYEWDFKCLTWNTLQSSYHKRERLWKLPEFSSKRNWRETWQVLMTQQLRIRNETVH